MELSRETLDNYRENLWCLREVTDKLLGHMKGHDYSFRRDITGKGGAFDDGALRALVEELLSGWAEYTREGIYPERPGGESPAEPYIRARREIYGIYLYLTMRCSLCEGAFAAARGGEEAERTDFAFILDHARRFARALCVMEAQNGERTCEPYQGFDAYFGFHLYHALTDPENQSLDSALTPLWRAPAQAMNRESSLTDEGNVKPVSIKHLSPPPFWEAESEPPEDDYDDYGPEEDYGDPGEDGWDMEDRPYDAGHTAYDYDAQWEEDDRAAQLSGLAASFDGREEYIEGCERFAALYRNAPVKVLRGFSEELEEIVNLYLLRRGLTVLTDTDKVLDVYSRVFDGPCLQAKRYARGLIWKKL